MSRANPAARLKLTKATAESAKGDRAGRYEIPDAKVTGLRLIVQPSGVKSWALRYTVGNRDRRLTIGTYSDDLGLDRARELASAAKLRVNLGADPAAEKVEARRIAAAGIAEGELFVTHWAAYRNAPKPKSRNKKGWRESTAERADQLFETRLKPKWGKRRLDEIKKADVNALLDEIASEHPHAATRARAVVGSFFNWCVARDRLMKSPCDDIERPAQPNKRKRKLTDDEIRWAWLACEKEPFPFGYIVRLLILTLARRTEVSGIRARELHLGNRRAWIIPAERTKNNHEHEIFLTDLMLEVIKSIPRVKNEAGFLFTTNGKTKFSGYSKAKKRFDKIMLEIARAEDPELTAIPNWTLHDLRRTGSTRMQRLGFEGEVVDACINHITGDSYKQHDFEPEKVKAFEAWSREVARIVTGKAANVVPMIRPKA
jgi:integrase